MPYDFDRHQTDDSLYANLNVYDTSQYRSTGSHIANGVDYFDFGTGSATPKFGGFLFDSFMRYSVYLDNEYLREGKPVSP